MYCKNCGKEMEGEAAFCPYCGRATKEEGGSHAQETPINQNAKSKHAGGLLGIFLGTIGVHNFYLGYTGKGVAQLLISLLTCGFGTIVTSIWGLIEGILILAGSINKEGRGNPLKD